MSRAIITCVRCGETFESLWASEVVKWDISHDEICPAPYDAQHEMVARQNEALARVRARGFAAPESLRGCHYRVSWSLEDAAWVATVDEFPSLSWAAESPLGALNGLVLLIDTDLIELGNA